MPDDAKSSIVVESQSQSGGAVAGPPAAQLAKHSPDYGYGGWLRFFCVVQIFIVPIRAVISLVTTVQDILNVSNLYPGLLFITCVEMIGDSAVIVFGVYACLMVRRLRPGSVRMVKLFLLSVVVWSFLVLALPFMGGGNLPSPVIAAWMAEAGKEAVRAVLVFAVWYTYFNISKRVKATFPKG